MAPQKGHGAVSLVVYEGMDTGISQRRLRPKVWGTNGLPVGSRKKLQQGCRDQEPQSLN